MPKKVILSADATCDLTDELREKYEVNCIPYHIVLDEIDYVDNVSITADDLYRAYWDHKALPKTAAISVGEYIDWFKQWTDEGHEVVHISLSSGVTASAGHAQMASEELEGVFVVDSLNLSSGCGHLVLEAAELIAQGLSGAETAQRVRELVPKVCSSFILDTLEFMHAGGRCSAVAKFGANLLGLKPCIEMDNKTGTMGVGKKYRGGDYGAILAKYAKEKLAAYGNISSKRIFITHSGIDEKYIEQVRRAIDETMRFDEVFVTRASCTISCHCGPNTLGILFMTR